ncbi:AI-2E family transporter [Streptococcus mitis]|uniref:AI-2E family transporter n=1 Tax=Streptococcus mitis TaxID=28037 RepID=UPI0039C0C53F
MFRKNKLFFWTSEILLLTIIFYLWRQMGGIITPFVSVANTIMIPFLLGGFLYYLTNPIVNFLQKYFRINRIIGILLTLCALVWGLVIGVVYLLPILINQLTSLIATSQTIYSRLQDLIVDTYPAFQNLDIQATIQQLNLSYVDILQNILNSVTNSVGSVLSALFSTVLIIIMTPVFLIYFLLDGHKFLPMLERTVLKRDKLHITGLLKNLNTTIARYISGVAIDAIIIGCLAFIGYSVIGLKYALVFAIFSGLANLIPYVGPSIGLIPMIIANVFTDPHRMLIAVVYMLIIQQVDGNILYPRIVGGVMKVHPITILVLLLLSSNIYGVIGMIVAVPTYSILKEISKFLSRLYENHKIMKERERELAK